MNFYRTFVIGVAAAMAAVTAASVGKVFGGERWFAGSAASQELVAAHDAYLRGDLKSTVLNLRDAWMQATTPNGSIDPAVASNILSLFGRVQEASTGRVPADWKLPSEIKYMRLAVGRRYAPHQDRTRFTISFYGETQVLDQVEQLKITRYPDVVLFDKKSGLGEWSDFLDEGKQPAFWGQANSSVEPPRAGLYLVDVQVRGRDAVHGWVILDQMVASQSPELISPSNGEIVGPQPTLKWHEFTSAEYRPYEKRSIYTRVQSTSDEDGDDEKAWSIYLRDPTTRSVTVGSTPGGYGLSQLSPGNYSYSVMYLERSYFGDLAVSRNSATFLPFIVRK